MFPKNIKEAIQKKSEIDSHSDCYVRSRLEADGRSYTQIHGEGSGAFSARVYYPRIKKLQNGRYIMFHQDGRVSGNTFYTMSDDCVHWEKRIPIFTSYRTVRDDGEEDFIYYCNCDAQVMPDGEILAFCSYRYRSGYNLDAKYSGIVMKRSLDNAQSWTEERTIYVGRNWESAPLLLKSGDLQLYFSHTAPKFYYDKRVKTDAKIHTSSGSAIIRSFDNGNTWIPDVKEPPYAAHRVTQNYVEELEGGTKCFTNQMPVAVELNCGDIALATESDMARGRFMLTMSYSHDNWARALDIDEDGPEDKLAAFDWGAGPYIVQFPSGETLLSYNTMDQFHLRLGDSKGKNMDALRDIVALHGNPGYWGGLLVEGDHCVIAAMPLVREDRTTRPWTSDNDMMICRYYLNHKISAQKTDRAFSEDAWNECDVLFLGSETDAQVCFGFMHDSEYLYLRIDRLDRTQGEGDCERVWIKLAGKKIKVSRTGNSVACDCDGADMLAGSEMYLTSSNDTDDDTKWGCVSIIKIKLPSSESECVSVCAEIDDDVAGEIKTSSFTGLSFEDESTWFEIELD